MLEIKRGGILLETSDLPFENHGVLNPAMIIFNGIIHMLYRAVDENLNSCIGYCQLDTPLHVQFRSTEPLLRPKYTYESFGIEDPRLVNIDEEFYLSYTAYDGRNALGALMTSTDLIHFQRRGILVPLIPIGERNRASKAMANDFEFSESEDTYLSDFVWDKNLVFFPRRIDGNLCFFHRIKPHILFVSIKNLVDLTPEFWNEYLLLKKGYQMNCPSIQSSTASYIGAGCPPIETDNGWLFVYHAAHEFQSEIVYKVHILLLDLKDPLIVLAELPYPILEPIMEYEIYGNVDQVVFPTGAIISNDQLYIYYGAADRCIACAYFSLSDLFKEFQYVSN